MKKDIKEHALEFLLDFDGLRHLYESGHYLKFEIERVKQSAQRPHGLGYSFTFHAPDGKRLMGFDNAHGVSGQGSRFKKRPTQTDHWHRTEQDPGRPYEFKDADTLLQDFFREVYRLQDELRIPGTVVRVEDRSKRS